MHKQSDWQSDSLIASYKRMLLATGDSKPALKLSLILTALAAVTEGLALVCLFPILQAVINEGNFEHAWQWFQIMLGLSLLEAFIRWHASYFSFSSEYSDVSYNLRLKLGEQLRKIPLFRLNQQNTGDICANLAGNVDEILAPMGTVSSLIIRSLLVPITVITCVLFIDWRLALLQLIIFPFMIPLYQNRRRAYIKATDTLAKANSKTTSEILEFTQGLAVLRASGTLNQQHQKLTDAFDHLEDIQVEGQKNGILPGILSATLVEGGLWLIALLGCIFVIEGSLALPNFIAIMVICARFSETLSFFINMTALFNLMDQGLKNLANLFAIPSLPSEVNNKPQVSNDIEFNQVNFYYDEQKILSNINLTIKENTLTAIVGSSGSGKTTLTRLLLRYVDPESGKILIGGQALNNMSPPQLMEKLSIVFQDVYLFDDTVMENIRMSRPNATDEEIQLAAHQAGCHEFISKLPLGYLTEVGDIGGLLSGGEKQRISIARAFLKDAPILILDEVTAALDADSEVAVQQAIRTLVEKRTVIVIAHRLASVISADQIVVMEQGEIVEKGKHAQLINNKGRYYDLWNAQEDLKNWHIH